ncbi:hypothetical protein RHGRI_000954 [Rhododendron griersonianum]|uniref:Protein kinase domain-containing protein n=1 Tax=Rhododendron griersonianum TaxID=479676 RepID=A0AAV6LIW7_9ERIC|nr:hypothetical protein RHGRI_000954 [Rhododendron griersonianum]
MQLGGLTIRDEAVEGGRKRDSIASTSASLELRISTSVVAVENRLRRSNPSAGKGMGSPSDLVEYTYETLDSLTGGFSAENYIGSTQYGEVFRGKIHEGMETREVIVKRWVKPSNVKTWPRFSARLEAEIKLLTDSVLCRHPNMVKLNGYCCENGRFGVVYDLKPLDTVHNLVLQDDFRWLGRIKAFSPRLVDFGLLVGGVFGGIPPSECEWGCVGYADPRLLESGNWSEKTDVFAYGIVLLGLIAKRRAYDASLDSRRGMNDGNTTYYWALKEYNTHSQSKVWGKFKKREPKSLVHKSFEMDPYLDVGDGVAITKLAMDCVGDDPKQRPTMKQVVCCLRGLNAVQFYGHIIGIPDEILRPPKLVIFESMGSPSDLVEYTYETLDSITGGFSAENKIGSTKYAELFRGEIDQGMETQEVLVKIFVHPSSVGKCPRFSARPDLRQSRLEAEIKLLTDSVMCRHPNMVKLYGYCCENGRFGVVYDLKPVDTVHNLVLQDDFKWLARIKVALEFAFLVECLHGEELLLRNTDAAHLIVDKAFSPRLLDFSLLVGGVFGGIPSRECEWGCVGYADPRLLESGNWSDKTDVFAYGIVLLGLIAKRRAYDTSLDSRRGMNDGNTTYYWALKEYNAHSQSKVWGKLKKRKPKSLVHKSFEMDPYFDAGDGITITKLAMDCVGDDPKQRPTMKQVVCCLRELNAVRFYGHIYNWHPW